MTGASADLAVTSPTATGSVRFVVLGGSAPATVQLVDALADWPAEPGCRRPAAFDLVLYGRSQERLDAVARAAALRAGALGLTVTVTAQTDRAAALAGADIVLNQIRPGGLEQRSADESFPRQFGIPGEETLGPGGFACAVRAVPALRPALGRRRPLLSRRAAGQPDQPGGNRHAGRAPRVRARCRLGL